MATKTRRVSLPTLTGPTRNDPVRFGAMRRNASEFDRARPSPYPATARSAPSASQPWTSGPPESRLCDSAHDRDRE
jgi:hypothetical protein